MSSPAGLLALLAGIIVLFAIAIAWGLRSRREYFGDAARTVNAEMLWTRFGTREWERDAMLFGVPADFAMTDAGWIVKDAHDREVAHVHGGVGGRTIEIGADRYRVTLLGTWLAGAEMHRVLGDATTSPDAVCRFQLTGPWTARVARYSVADDAPIDIPRPIGWPKARVAIVRDGAEIGAWCVLNVNRPMARVVLLPASVPLAARVFVLAMG